MRFVLESVPGARGRQEEGKFMQPHAASCVPSIIEVVGAGSRESGQGLANALIRHSASKYGAKANNKDPPLSVQRSVRANHSIAIRLSTS